MLTELILAMVLGGNLAAAGAIWLWAGSRALFPYPAQETEKENVRTDRRR